MWAVILTQQVQRQINPRGHTRRGVEVVVLHKQSIRIQLCTGAQAGEGSRIAPVRSDPPPLQQSGPRQ